MDSTGASPDFLIKLSFSEWRREFAAGGVSRLLALVVPDLPAKLHSRTDFISFLRIGNTN